MSYQLALDLFGEEKSKQSPLEFFLGWAHDTHGCGCEIDAIAIDVFERMPHPFDRCKALVTVFRCGRDGNDVVPLLGLFDEGDYHVCWDRAFAYVNGVPSETVKNIRSCDYRCHSGAHVFYDADGEVVWEMIETTRRD